MIAVTGAAGFIGSNLAHRLAGQGHELLLVDHPPTDANLVGLERFPLLAADEFLPLLDRDRPKVAGVFHLGATDIQSGLFSW